MAEQTLGPLALMMADGANLGGRTASEMLDEKNESPRWRLLWGRFPIEQRAEAMASKHVEKIVRWLRAEYHRHLADIIEKANHDQTPDSERLCLRAAHSLDLWVLAKMAEVRSDQFRWALQVFATSQQPPEQPTPEQRDQTANEWVWDPRLLSSWALELLQALSLTDLLSETQSPNLPITFPSILEFLRLSAGEQISADLTLNERQQPPDEWMAGELLLAVMAKKQREAESEQCKMTHGASSPLAAHTAANEQRGADNVNGQADTPKKSGKKSKRRLPDKHVKACIKEFKEYRNRGEPQSMRDIVKEYVATHDGVSESGTYRRLTDNRDQWAT